MNFIGRLQDRCILLCLIVIKKPTQIWIRNDLINICGLSVYL